MRSRIRSFTASGAPDEFIRSTTQSKLGGKSDGFPEPCDVGGVVSLGPIEIKNAHPRGEGDQVPQKVA